MITEILVSFTKDEYSVMEGDTVEVCVRKVLGNLPPSGFVDLLISTASSTAIGIIILMQIPDQLQANTSGKIKWICNTHFYNYVALRLLLFLVPLFAIYISCVDMYDLIFLLTLYTYYI